MLITSGRTMLIRRIYSSMRSFNKSHNNTFRKSMEKHNDEILGKMVVNALIKDESDVALMKNKILKNSDVFTSDNIDRSLLVYFIKNKQFRIALDYIRFLDEETKNKLHLFLINQQFLIYFNKRYEKGTLSISEQEFIIELYNNLRKESTVLNSLLLESAILALSLTSEWEQCLTLLNELKKLESPRNLCYSAVIAGAFLNNKEEIAWTLLDEMFVLQRAPNDIVFKAYLENLEKLSDKEKILSHLHKFLQIYGEKNFIFTENSILELCTLLKKSGLSLRLSSVNNRGYCENCNEKLDLCELGNDVFENLRKKIVESVIVGKNIFNKTSPAEFDRFQAFLKSLDGGDVVIDGLNIAYVAGTKQTPAVYSSLLAKVVAHFVERKKKVIVIGRKHMSSWPREYWDYIRYNARVFLTQDLSLDDPYLLYCTLHCGKNAILVSRDLMRSHVCLLSDPKDKLMFSRWLEQRQYQLIRIKNDGKILFRVPRSYTRTVQHNNSCLHIPYDTVENESKGNFGGLDKWLCMKIS